MTQVQLQHTRYIRHRKFRGRDRGTTGVSRNTKLDAFLDQSATDVNGTGTADTFTGVNATDIITATAHGLSSGAGPYVLSNSGGALPVGLSITTLYWMNVVTVNTLTLHLSFEDGVTGSNKVDFTTDGTGTHSFTPADTADALVEVMRQQVSPTRVQLATDIDNLIPTV